MLGSLGAGFFESEQLSKRWLGYGDNSKHQMQRDARPPRTCSSRLFDCDGATDEITPVAYFGERREPLP